MFLVKKGFIAFEFDCQVTLILIHVYVCVFFFLPSYPRVALLIWNLNCHYLVDFCLPLNTLERKSILSCDEHAVWFMNVQ